MNLNHLNLTVPDVQATEEFLKKYFDLKTVTTRGDSFTLLSDDQGMLLALMKGQAEYPKSFHIGFVQESDEQVNKINQRMKEDGIDVDPPRNAHGWTFYVQAPGGFTVEVLSLERLKR